MSEKITIKLAVRNWDYGIFNDPILMEIKNLEDTSIQIEDSGYRFYGGAVLVFVTIVSVAANLAAIADFLYKYFKQNKNSGVTLEINGKEITIEGSPEAIKDIILSQFENDYLEENEVKDNDTNKS